MRRFPICLAATVAALSLAAHADAAPPQNDDFGLAIELTGNELSAVGSNESASKEAGEPDHAGNSGGASIWWRWTAPVTQTYGVDTCGSDFDTLLAVYEGTVLSELTPISSNDDNDGSCATTVASLLTFEASAGAPYRIAVDGFAGAEGAVNLKISDITAPATSFTDGPEEGERTNSTSAVLDWQASEPVERFECDEFGAGFSECSRPRQLDGLSEGPQQIKVRSVDEAGNTGGAVTRNWIIDTTAPAPTIVEPSPGTTYEQRRPKISGTAGTAEGDAEEVTVEIFAGGGARIYALTASVGGDGSWSVTPPAELGDGGYTTQVVQADEAGNEGFSVVRGFAVEGPAPDTRVLSGPGGATAETRPTFTFDSPGPDPARRAVAGFQCRIDSAGWRSCSSPYRPAKGLADGLHGFEVRAVGNFGKRDPTPARRSFTVDTEVVFAKVRAKRRQKQRGRRIVVKLKASAAEAIDAKASGKVKVKAGKRKKTYKLKRAKASAGPGAKAKLKLKPRRRKHARKIARALKRGKRVTSRVSVKLSDALGNDVGERVRVRLK